MRICYHCGRLTSGRPLFCHYCGRSYAVKLCPRLHLNPRFAQVCSQCGSRELSLPHERLPIWFKLLSLFFGLIPGIALLFSSLIYIGYFLVHLLQNPATLLIPMLYGLALGLAWLIWLYVPVLLLKLLRRTRGKTES